jgi:hypothetical protein
MIEQELKKNTILPGKKNDCRYAMFFKFPVIIQVIT